MCTLSPLVVPKSLKETKSAPQTPTTPSIVVTEHNEHFNPLQLKEVEKVKTPEQPPESPIESQDRKECKQPTNVKDKSPFSSFNSLTEETSSLTEEHEADGEVSENEDISVFEDDFQQRVIAYPSSRPQRRPSYLNTSRPHYLPRSKSAAFTKAPKDPDHGPVVSPAVSDCGGYSPRGPISKMEDKKVSYIFHVKSAYFIM